MIYVVTNPVVFAENYICPDLASVEAGKLLYPSGIFSIGSKEEADAIANQNKTAWMTQNISLFSVNKDINPDPIDTTWLVCDLNLEPENNNIDYNIFNVINGYYTLVTGLDNAKALLEETKVNARNFMVYIVELDNWPPSTKQLSNGLQTL